MIAFNDWADAILNRVRWQRLLWSCRLDPDRLHPPVEEPESRNFIICGQPRSGTSLMASQLFHPPDVAICMEPWDGLRLAPAELFRSIRREIAQTGKLSRGRLDVSALSQGRVAWHADGAGVYPIEVAVEYALGVKWPAFWRYLDLLPKTPFIICVRDPVDVITSFGRNGGRLASGLEYDVAFHRRMNRHLAGATRDPIVRRSLLYEYITRRILPHLERREILLIRYERWSTEPEKVLEDIAHFLDLRIPTVPQVPIRIPSHQVPEPEILEVIRRYCPSAAALGYQV